MFGPCKGCRGFAALLEDKEGMMHGCFAVLESPERELQLSYDASFWIFQGFRTRDPLMSKKESPKNRMSRSNDDLSFGDLGWNGDESH